MLRVWPAQGAQPSAESASFLKVDPRKKQVTLYDQAAGPPGSSGPRRASTAAPKMFAFDAVFPQDSEQVRGRPQACPCFWCPGRKRRGCERGPVVRARPAVCFPPWLGPGVLLPFSWRCCGAVCRSAGFSVGSGGGLGAGFAVCRVHVSIGGAERSLSQVAPRGRVSCAPDWPTPCVSCACVVSSESRGPCPAC